MRENDVTLYTSRSEVTRKWHHLTGSHLEEAIESL